MGGWARRAPEVVGRSLRRHAARQHRRAATHRRLHADGRHGRRGVRGGGMGALREHETARSRSHVVERSVARNRCRQPGLVQDSPRESRRLAGLFRRRRGGRDRREHRYNARSAVRLSPRGTRKGREVDTMEHCVFIHGNPKQIVGAIVGKYALKRNSRNSDKFDVRIISTDDYPFLTEYEGKEYLRDGVKRVWLNDDLQSFTPLRFMPPEVMGYQGRAVITDPDVFAIGDIWDLLSRDMQGKAIVARARSGTKGLIDHCMATSVMLLDCAKLTHWRCEAQFRSMFDFELDYSDWICLKHENRETIGLLENEWNDFDHLTAKTKMLHTTRRKTQPWKTGLPVDWRIAERFRLFPPIGWLMRARRKLFGEYAFLGNYKEHPDRNQENLFFGLLRECLEQGKVTEQMLRDEMQHNHVRHDAFEVLDRAPALAPPGNPPIALSS